MHLYVDDPDEGLSADTSHPHFVELAPAGFYDEMNDFAPFGSDDGNDALRELEEWYGQHGADADPVEFLGELLDEWGFGLPADVLDLSDGDLLAFVGEGDSDEAYLTAVARARIAVALGQLKIVGAISEAMQAEGRRGLRVLGVLHADSSRYPDWPYRGEALQALAAIQDVLDRV
jgi:uncharacterized protein YfeS